MKKMFEKLKDLRVLLAIAVIFMLPAFVCSIALGYVPTVTWLLMIPSAVIGAYFFIFKWLLPILGWVVNPIKKKLKK